MKRINYKKLYENINNSKYLSGLALISLNLFSKYVQIKLSKSQEEFIKNAITREILIFTILFVGVKDIVTAIILTAAFSIVSNTVFNHKSRFCMLPEKYKKLEKAIDLNDDDVITDEEIEKAKKILEKASLKNKNINIY